MAVEQPVLEYQSAADLREGLLSGGSTSAREDAWHRGADMVLRVALLVQLYDRRPLRLRAARYTESAATAGHPVNSAPGGATGAYYATHDPTDVPGLAGSLTKSAAPEATVIPCAAQSAANASARLARVGRPCERMIRPGWTGVSTPRELLPVSPRHVARTTAERPRVRHGGASASGVRWRSSRTCAGPL